MMTDNNWSATSLGIDTGTDISNGISTVFSTDSLAKGFIKHLLAIDNTIPPVISQTLWQALVKHYDDPTRAYHNLSHLRQLFDQFERVKSHLQQPAIVALALFYHDIIYDPKKSDNELKSAEYAVTYLQDYLTPEQCQRIYALIMMTTTHQLNDNNDNISDSDAAFLLDMDLSILAADWADYQRYAQAVRQEYVHVASDDYRHGRIAVLEGLLAHDRLYLTQDYHQRLEQIARGNIRREIELLQVS